MSTARFNKRIYTLPNFIASIRDIFNHLDELRTATRAGRVSHAFAEKIMLAVTHVNGCRYCAYGHTRATLASGVSEAELQKIMSGELGDFPEQDAVALTFAQHYAESACQPDPAAWKRLSDYYGPHTSQDILAYLRMITFGNLFGNTFDAFLSRLVARPAIGSSLLNELGVLLGGFVILPFEMFKRLIKRLFTRHQQVGTNHPLTKEK